MHDRLPLELGYLRARFVDRALMQVQRIALDAGLERASVDAWCRARGARVEWIEPDAQTTGQKADHRDGSGIDAQRCSGAAPGYRSGTRVRCGGTAQDGQRRRIALS